ncbi:MAG TPA: hypothetical protein VGF24_07920 [Vicinamibacterales bacterium]|jgi:hypothetical protein
MLSIRDGRRWALVAYAYALVVTAVLGYFLFGLVIQVSDSFGNLLAVQTPTLGAVVRDHGFQRGYLRPFLWAQIKIVYELSGGHYYAWFRGIHVAQLAILVVLCLRLLRPKTSLDAALVPLALAILTGVHTFAPMMREAFPINSFLTIAICCLAAANLAFRDRARWYTDVLVIVLFAGSVLTVESGILVWVVCVGAALLGLRGVSRPALVATTICLIAYVAGRMSLGVGAPSLAERAAGFGFRMLEPADLIARFEARAWIFYVYNVISSISTVLFSEPTGGVWRFVYELTHANVHPWTLVSVLSSTASTAFLAWFLWTRRGRIRARTLADDDRLVLLLLIVLVANAFISFSYTKNVIMSPAGVFLPGAVYVSARAWLLAAAPRRAALAVALVTILSCGWAFRAAGTYYNLRSTAAEKRAEWVLVDAWLERQHIALAGDQARALRDGLRRDALWTYPTPFQPSVTWLRWFDIDW